MKFEVENVKCQKCANTIKNALKEDFGKIEVNVEEKTVEVNIEENQVQKFIDEMDDLGFTVKSKIN